jgi:site-specific recombinase XerD
MDIDPSTTVVSFDPVFAQPEQLALAGFLAGYSGQTRQAYALDLRQFAVWCINHGIQLFAAKRADIECFARDLEQRGRARATIARRLFTVIGFYRYAEEEELIEHSPAVHVRRPRLDYESHAIGLDRNELGALLVAAGLGGHQDHALMSLFILNGLRVSEATGANIEALALQRRHRTLTVHCRPDSCRSSGRAESPARFLQPIRHVGRTHRRARANLKGSGVGSRDVARQT